MAINMWKRVRVFASDLVEEAVVNALTPVAICLLDQDSGTAQGLLLGLMMPASAISWIFCSATARLARGRRRRVRCASPVSCWTKVGACAVLVPGH